MLHFLATREFPRLGSIQAPSRFDVRLIATSSDTLFEDVMSGRFRDDLFYRLNMVYVSLPPLRQRRDDIPVLFHHFIRVMSVQLGLPAPRLTDEAEAALHGYAWPGNVVQIQEVAQRLVVGSVGETVGAHDLPREILAAAPSLDRLLRES